MGKHSLRPHRGAARVTVSAFALSATVAGALAVPAHADEVDALIEEMDTLSQEATGKSEELKAIEDEIAAAEGRLGEMRERVEHTRDAAAQAVADREAQREAFDTVAASANRTSTADTVITSLGAENPQALIDRAAYLGAISRNTDRALDELRAANEEAAERANAANIAVAEAEFQRNQLDSKRAKLERERGELDEKVREVEEKINSLSADQRARWENKYNPIANPVLLPGAGEGVVGAALAQLGKPYGWGAAGPGAFDCSGLMVWAYGQNGKSIPRTSQAQLAGGTPVPVSQLQPGDIVGYYPGVTHVGMYIGNGQVVHASDYGIPVQVVPLNSMPVQGAVRY
ncbi:C40 family peptidase [Corynebacterium timonense]|uniref:NlpC/P60 family protein n=1 Tax=Corynebacterium timonense TaxID=441500 RepID=A0A1H1MI99_9CORY|nr:C40 family peptidase [Corynebacterium timonense]SDR86561.1 NlpC/P60 family protein [Corynebacterium timonense]